MNWILFRKDVRLLRNYLRSAAFCTAACYFVTAACILLLADYQSEEVRTPMAQTVMTLRTGSTIGFSASIFFAALLAGSVFTLERADRSAEFLACLPPTRRQNLISKLAVILVATVLMISVHFAASICSQLMLPHVRARAQLLPSGTEPTPWVTLATFVAIASSVIGGSLATSAWLRSNGVPILCGLLTPMFVFSLQATMGFLLGVQTEGQDLQMRMLMAASVTGAVLTFLGCYWYLTKAEP